MTDLEAQAREALPARLLLRRVDNDVLTAFVPYFKSGQLAPLAVTSAIRSPLVPDVPSVVEAGYRQLVLDNFFRPQRAGRQRRGLQALTGTSVASAAGPGAAMVRAQSNGEHPAAVRLAP